MRFVKARQLFDGEKFVEGKEVVVLREGTVVDFIEESQTDPLNIQRFEGILMPGFVNVHAHLELSHLKGKIEQKTGLPGFAKQIVSQRNHLSIDERLEHMAEADKQLFQNGIVAVGDISNTSESFEVKANSKINYHTFVELIGLKPEAKDIILNSGLQLINQAREFGIVASMAAHAPYSVSVELMRAIAFWNAEHRQPFSLHNQESQEEEKFLLGEASRFDDLYKFLNLDIGWYQPPHQNGMESYAEAIITQPSILVHNTFTRSEDIEIVKQTNPFWCFCPLANLYIEDRLPNYTIFSNVRSRICIGTDSLASNKSLDVVAEANTILNATSTFKTEDILKAITYNGAAALGIQGRFGKLCVNTKPGINLVESKNNQIQFIKKVV